MAWVSSREQIPQIELCRGEQASAEWVELLKGPASARAEDSSAVLTYSFVKGTSCLATGLR